MNVLDYIEPNSRFTVCDVYIEVTTHIGNRLHYTDYNGYITLTKKYIYLTIVLDD